MMWWLSTNEHFFLQKTSSFSWGSADTGFTRRVNKFQDLYPVHTLQKKLGTSISLYSHPPFLHILSIASKTNEEFAVEIARLFEISGLPWTPSLKPERDGNWWEINLDYERGGNAESFSNTFPKRILTDFWAASGPMFCCWIISPFWKKLGFYFEWFVFKDSFTTRE
jgi:hypothetical protein